MRIHWEATLTSHSEGVIELESQEIEHYNSLTAEDDKTDWLHSLVVSEAPYDIHSTYVDTANWRVEEED